MHILAELLTESGTDSANHVEQQETAGPPLRLHDPAEHPHGEHVEENVLESVMKEHVGDELPDLESRSKEEMQSEIVADVNMVFLHRHCTHPAKYIDDEKILGYGR